MAKLLRWCCLVWSIFYVFICQVVFVVILGFWTSECLIRTACCVSVRARWSVGSLIVSAVAVTFFKGEVLVLRALRPKVFLALGSCAGLGLLSPTIYMLT